MTRRRLGPAALWAANRSDNIDRLIEELKRDDAVLFSTSAQQLDVLSKLLSALGDDPGSMLAAVCARMFEGKLLIDRTGKLHARRARRSKR